MLDTSAIERLRRLGGDAFLAEMIDLFLENAPDRISAAREAGRSLDYGSLQRAAHSLKSTAGNVGAREVQSLAEQLESLAADGDGDTLGQLLEELDSAWARVRPELEQQRPEDGES